MGNEVTAATTATVRKQKTLESSDSEDEVIDSEDDVIDSERSSRVYSALVDGKSCLHPKRKPYALKDLKISENQKKFVELNKYKVKVGSPNEKIRNLGLLRLRGKTCSIVWQLVFASMKSLIMTPEIKKFQDELMNVTKGNLIAIEKHFLCAALVIGETSENAAMLYKLAGGKRKLPTVQNALLGLLDEAKQTKEFHSSSASASSSATAAAIETVHRPASLDARVIAAAPAPAPAQAAATAAVNRLASLDARVIAAPRVNLLSTHAVPDNAIAKQLVSNVKK